jgi:hypothetical protein
MEEAKRARKAETPKQPSLQPKVRRAVFLSQSQVHPSSHKFTQVHTTGSVSGLLSAYASLWPWYIPSSVKSFLCNMRFDFSAMKSISYVPSL